MTTGDGHIAFVIIFAVTFIGTCVMVAFGVVGDVGVGVEDTELVSDITGVGYGYSGTSAGCRQMNGTLWHFALEKNGGDSDLWASWSEDNGSTWNQSVIFDEDDPGFSLGGYPMKLWDAVALSNNSIVLMLTLYAYTTANNREVHLLSHWNNSDLTQWERTAIYVSEAYDVDVDCASMAVNSTDQVMVCYERDAQNYVHYDIWHPSTRTIDTQNIGSQEPQTYCGPFAMVNMTNVFLVGYSKASPVDEASVYEGDGGFALVATFSEGTNYNTYDMAVTPDDTILALQHFNVGGMGWFYLKYWNSTASGTRSIMSDGTDCPIGVKLGLIENDNGSLVRVYYYSQGDDYYTTNVHHYYRGNIVWRTGWGTVWTETDDVQDFVGWAPVDLYPRLQDPDTSEWNHTQLPISLSVYCHLYEYDNVGDFDYWEIHTSNLTFGGIPFFTYDPYYSPPGPSPDGGDEPINMNLWDEACIGTWAIYIILILFVLFILGIAGLMMK